MDSETLRAQIWLRAHADALDSDEIAANLGHRRHLVIDQEGLPDVVALHRYMWTYHGALPGSAIGCLFCRPRVTPPPWLLALYGLAVRDRRRRGIPDTDNPFAEGMAVIPSCLAMQGILHALHKEARSTGDWERPDYNVPVSHYHRPGGEIDTYLLLPNSSKADVQAADILWSTVKDLGDLDADVLLVALAQAIAHPGKDGTTWLKAQNVLDYRGIQPITKNQMGVMRRAGHRTESVLEVARSMARLDQLWVKLHQVEVIRIEGQRRHRSSHSDCSKVLLVSEYVGQVRSEDGDLPIAWRYKPGTWLPPFLTSPNRQTALLHQQALRYDPYHQIWQKRLARYIALHLRLNTRRNRVLKRQIGVLLDDLNLPLTPDRPERTKSRLERALNDLSRDGVIATWAYTAEPQARLAVLPSRRWLPSWLRLSIEVIPVPRGPTL